MSTGGLKKLQGHLRKLQFKKLGVQYGRVRLTIINYIQNNVQKV